METEKINHLTNKNIKKKCNTHRSHVLQFTKPTYVLSESGTVYSLFATQISDHMDSFVALNFNINNKYKHLETICIGSFRVNQMNCFLCELESINWLQMCNHDTATDPLISRDQQFLFFPIELQCICLNCDRNKVVCVYSKSTTDPAHNLLALVSLG